MRQAAPYIDKDTLVIFDIDNTIMETKQTLGSNQWFEYRIGVYKSKGMNEFDALENALHEWMAAQHITEVKLVEPCISDFIKDLQEKNITIIGLTTRGLGLSTCTFHQLQRLSVDLSKTSPSQKEIHFINGKEGVLFRKGILFTAGTQKGKALDTLLSQIGFHPKKILFINDKRKHLEAVEIVYEDSNTVFTGLRYGYLDEKVKNFAPEIADLQFSQFGQIISDAKAKKILEKLR